MISEKKGIYHSNLVKFGPAFVTITSDVFKSKYPNKDGSDKYCVAMEHEGVEQIYTVENEACAEALRGLNGQQVTIEASGGRDTATIAVNGQSKAPGASPRRSSAGSGSTQPTPQLNETDRLNQIMNALYKVELAVKAETDAAEKQGIPSDPANFGGKCGNVMRLMGNQFIDSQPTDPAWEKKKKKPETPAPATPAPSDDEVPF